MKCPRCDLLNSEDDRACVGCGAPLRGTTVTPAWAYVFVGLCALIPLVSLGGAIPAALGGGGAVGCLQVARAGSIPPALRMVMCLGITALCWALFVAMLVVMARMRR